MSIRVWNLLWCIWVVTGHTVSWGGLNAPARTLFSSTSQQNIVYPRTEYPRYMGTAGWDACAGDTAPLQKAMSTMLGDPDAHIESLRFTALKYAFMGRTESDFWNLACFW